MPIKSDVELLPHQAKAAQKALEADGTFLIGHTTGAGKTLSSIASFDALRSAGKASKALVVTPSSLRSNFTRGGIEAFTNDDFASYGNSEEVSKGTHLDIRDAKIPDVPYHVVSYEMFRQSPSTFLDKIKPDTLILDEIHRAKDEHGLTHETMKEVRPKVRNVIGITSSFVGNSPSDVVGILNSILPEESLPFKNRAEFEKKYLYQAPNGNIGIRDVAALSKMLGKHIDYYGPGSKDFNTGDVAPIPRKDVEEVHVEMSPLQEKLTRYVFNQLSPLVKWKMESDAGDLSSKDVSHIFSKIMAARQIANSTHVLDGRTSATQSARTTPKIKKILDDVETHLNETKDGQALLVTHLVNGGVDVLQAGLEDRKVPHGVFVGQGRMGANKESNEKAIADYKSGKNKVLVISPAGGEGLSLPDTTFVGVLDGHFNPEKILQLEARGIRAGGQAARHIEDRNVLVRRYLSVPSNSRMRPIVNWLKRISYGVFGSPEETKSTDKWIYEAARSKAQANAQIREELAKQSSSTLVGVLSKFAVVQEALLGEMLKNYHHASTEVDRPKGTVHPATGATYPVDYGFLSNVDNPQDGEGADAFFLTHHKNPETKPVAYFETPKARELKLIASDHPLTGEEEDTFRQFFHQMGPTSPPIDIRKLAKEEERYEKFAEVLSTLLEINSPIARDKIRMLQQDIRTLHPETVNTDTHPHMTMAIADVPKENVSKATTALKQLLSGSMGKLVLDSVDTFKSPSGYTLVHLVPRHGEELQSAHGKVKAILEEHGGSLNRENLRPHVTLARIDKKLQQHELDKLNQLLGAAISTDTSPGFGVKGEGRKWNKVAYPIKSVKEIYWDRFGDKLHHRDFARGGRPSDKEKLFLTLLHLGANGMFHLPQDMVEMLMAHAPQVLKFLSTHKGDIEGILKTLSEEEHDTLRRMKPDEALRHVRGHEKSADEKKTLPRVRTHVTTPVP